LAASPVLSRPASAADVRALPWAGNHASDHYLFLLCDEAVRAAAARGDRAGARAILFAVGDAGMGLTDPVDDATLDGYLAGE
jgi:hypothetical protein